MTNLFAKALVFAARKHAGLKRRNGDNYIIHPIRVSQEVFTERQKVIALLHDTLEDTSTTYGELVDEFGIDIADDVEVLTHKKGQPYAEYIARIKNSGSEDAVRVKMADIADNLNDSPSDNAIKKMALGITELSHAG